MSLCQSSHSSIIVTRWNDVPLRSRRSRVSDWLSRKTGTEQISSNGFNVATTAGTYRRTIIFGRGDFAGEAKTKIWGRQLLTLLCIYRKMIPVKNGVCYIFCGSKNILGKGDSCPQDFSVATCLNRWHNKRSSCSLAVAYAEVVTEYRQNKNYAQLSLHDKEPIVRGYLEYSCSKLTMAIPNVEIMLYVFRLFAIWF